MTPGPARVAPGALQAVLWRLLDASDREDPAAFLALVDAAGDAFAGSGEPTWTAWRHAVDARRALLDGDEDGRAAGVAAARELLDECPVSSETALLVAIPIHLIALRRARVSILRVLAGSLVPLLAAAVCAGLPSAQKP